MTKLRKQFSKKYKGSPWKGKPGKSMTVPDQNLTIAELQQQILEKQSPL